MQEGDLVHIPQGTEMWIETEKGMRLRTSKKPRVGIYLSAMSQHVYRVYAGGDWNIKKRDAYPMGETSATS
mgnify:CR=1 FL=1